MSGDKACFVICPIGEEGSDSRKRSDAVLKHVVSAAIDELGYHAYRADDLAHSGLINPKVFERLQNDPLVIADLTGGNPNVMYELAVRHVLRKPVIHIKQYGDQTPFDLGNIQIIEYDLASVPKTEDAKKEIRSCISEIERGEVPQYTPIDFAIDLQHFQKSKQPEQRSLIELVSMVSEARSGITATESGIRQILNVLRSEHDPADSVFQERAGHYRKEKRYLAQQFVRRILGSRVAQLKEKVGDRRLQIIFDSGSTISPMIHVLGQDAESDPVHWCRDVPVITNSIKAVDNILRYRDRPGDRYAGLPVRHFSVLPGEVLAAFEAIADPRTLSALEELRDPKAYTIAITTGNYILLHNGEFLPIARAGYHPDFKATLYDIASEVYVVAPLGKVLMWTGDAAKSLKDLCTHLNHELGFKVLPREEESADKQYQLVNEKLVWSKRNARASRRKEDLDPTSWLRKTVLVTTHRTEQCLFHPHSVRLEAQARKREFRVDWDVETGPYFWTVPFSALPVSPEDQLEIEIPHENLRKVASHYFFLPAPWGRPEVKKGRGYRP